MANSPNSSGRKNAGRIHNHNIPSRKGWGKKHVNRQIRRIATREIRKGV